MEKQTAVEWVIEKYINKNRGLEVFMKAIQMEKEQIIEAFEDGNEHVFISKTGEEYYNETYKIKKITPEEKAKELFNKFSRHIMHFDEFEGWKEYIDSSEAKQFALIAVDEILNILNFSLDFKMNKSIKYWLDVKDEIENL